MLLSFLPLLISAVVQPQFLPEDAKVACRAILPNVLPESSGEFSALRTRRSMRLFRWPVREPKNDLLRDDASPTPSGADLSPGQ